MTDPYTPAPGSTVWGGQLAEYVGEGVRHFPDEARRPVRISAHSYGGIVAGAYHWWVRVECIDNPYVDCRCRGATEPHAHRFWDDPTAHSHTLHQYHLETDAAKDRALALLLALFERRGRPVWRDWDDDEDD